MSTTTDSNASPMWMIYGANGYTGQLIAERAVAEGQQPVLAGRNGEKVKAIAEQLNLPYRVFDLANTKDVDDALQGVKAVMHCAGPFSSTSEPMVEACIRAGAHYLDITGEIKVFEMIKSKDAKAKAAGVTLLPGVGFDVVPSDCLAAMLAEKLPDATHLEMAFYGDGGTSPGTAKTMVEMLGDGGRIRRNGQIKKVAAGYRQRNIPFAEGPRWCMTIPWGDISTAYTSTGIPNIMVYTWVPKMAGIIARLISPLMIIMRNKKVQDYLKAQVDKNVQGPDASTRSSGFMNLWGKVRNKAGQDCEAWLSIPDGYQFTVDAAFTSTQNLLAGKAEAGTQTPSSAFGKDFVLSLENSQIKFSK